MCTHCTTDLELARAQNGIVGHFALGQSILFIQVIDIMYYILRRITQCHRSKRPTTIKMRIRCSNFLLGNVNQTLLAFFH